LSADGLRGKVVLIDFWTYTCINWLRTVPYVRAWAEKYKEEGLVVIGVSTPEFEFEHTVENVRRAVKHIAKGRIRYHHFGEGGYEQSERMIQQLLAEARRGGGDRTLVTVTGAGIEAPADWGSLKSPENYLGYGRTENFASLGGAVFDKPHAYAAPRRLGLNHWALSGGWTMGKQATVLNRANGRIVYRFHARDLHLVMGPVAPGASVRFRLLIDGRPPGAAHGLDVDAQGYGRVTEQRLYQLIRQQRPISDREVVIEFLDPGVAVFAFTFG
jgi:thiol-disulfide isomerase/thioredoxin